MLPQEMFSYGGSFPREAQNFLNDPRVYIYIYIHDKFQDFFHIGTFIDSTHMKL